VTTTATPTTPATPRGPAPVDRSSGPLSKANLWSAVVASYIPLIIATLVVATPLVWMILSSFKTPQELLNRDIQIFPDSFAPANYVDAAKKVPFARLFLNSAIVTIIGAGIKVLLAISTAYAVVFVRFPFKKVIFAAILVTLMVPPQVALLPNYILITGLGGNDTYWGIILPGLGTGFGTFLLRQYFMTIPLSLVEAAEIDGAGHWRRLTRIIAPISAPTIATVALVSIVFEWNDYLWPLVITTNPNLMTLPVGLTLLNNSESSTLAYGTLMAGSVAVIVPVLIVFIALQRYIIAGLTQGAVKD
jgi:sn-glycerol 3-phosphate transport system permease protein